MSQEFEKYTFVSRGRCSDSLRTGRSGFRSLLGVRGFSLHYNASGLALVATQPPPMDTGALS